MTEKKIEIKQTVYFDTNKATIKTVSFPLLDEVAQALKDNPTIKVEVQGHTDSQGNDAFNLKLSQNRAESACGRTSIEQGVAPEPDDRQGLRRGRADRRQPDRGRPGPEPARRVRDHAIAG